MRLTTVPLGPQEHRLLLAGAEAGCSPSPCSVRYVPLGGGGSHTDDHDGGVCQDLLQVLIVLALVQAITQLLW